MLLLAQPRKISFLLEKFSKSLDLPVKKQNASWGAKRIPRRVLFFHGRNRDFSRIFQVRTRFYEAVPAITHVLTSGPVFPQIEAGWGSALGVHGVDSGVHGGPVFSQIRE